MEKAFCPGRWCPQEGCTPLKDIFIDYLLAASKHWGHISPKAGRGKKQQGPWQPVFFSW